MDILGESVDGIENGGFSAADAEISYKGMAKGLFQSPRTLMTCLQEGCINFYNSYLYNPKLVIIFVI